LEQGPSEERQEASIPAGLDGPELRDADAEPQGEADEELTTGKTN